MLVLAVVALFTLMPAAAVAQPFLTAADVMDITRTAATAISPTSIVIAVVDRAGEVLGVYEGTAGASAAFINGNITQQLYQGGPPAGVAGVPAGDYAVGLARTGAFFSNNNAPLSSRTVRFISGIHFPPGIENKPPAALYGIENTNRGCDFNVAIAGIPRATSLNGAACGPGPGAITGCGTGIVTGKADIFDSDPATVDGGGVPVFKGGVLVGGVGVTGVGIDKNATEFAAFAGSIPGPGFGPRPADPGVIYLDGIALPFVKNTKRPAGVGPGIFNAAGFVVGPIPSTNGAAGVPKGYLVGPAASADGKLSAANVNTIVGRGIDEARRTRAAIRLPIGTTTQMVFAVSDLAGNIVALYRMEDATIFSIDVAVAKARNAVYFSSRTRDPRDIPGVPLGTSITARTISFGAQPLYPAGIDRTKPGPFFGDFVLDVFNPCSQGFAPAAATQSGIVFFPGSIGLYSGTDVIGGIGVSGDGVEQDDFVTASTVAQINCPLCAPNWTPPLSIRADRVIIGDVRLPYFKFPRNPEVR
ncbi:MAG TPA: heme-binding protein [Methylomirabilota bacterium]